MAQIIDINGTIKAVKPKNGRDFSLKELQKAVGGYIEIVRLSNNIVMVVNEEGWLRGLEFNKAASLMCVKNGYAASIAGNVLVCKDRQIR